MKLLRVLLFSVLACFLFSKASAYDNVAFHCNSDTTVINELLRSPELKHMEPNQRVAFFAGKFIGASSAMKEEILEAESVPFSVNIHSFTPLSLISTCLALAQAYESSSAPNWRDFADKFEGIMYKGGKEGDFVSRFLYPADWIADNIFRGNIYDATFDFDGLNTKKKERSIDYISHNKDSFKAFADTKNLDRIKMLEMGFRNHQIPYVTTGDLVNPNRFKQQSKDGDVFFLLATDYNLDSREMGILTHDGDKVMIIQLSPLKDSVTLEELPFELYVKRNIKRIQGARIIRIKQ